MASVRAYGPVHEAGGVGWVDRWEQNERAYPSALSKNTCCITSVPHLLSQNLMVMEVLNIHHGLLCGFLSLLQP